MHTRRILKGMAHLIYPTSITPSHIDVQPNYKVLDLILTRVGCSFGDDPDFLHNTHKQNLDVLPSVVTLYPVSTVTTLPIGRARGSSALYLGLVFNNSRACPALAYRYIFMEGGDHRTYTLLCDHLSSTMQSSLPLLSY